MSQILEVEQALYRDIHTASLRTGSATGAAAGGDARGVSVDGDGWSTEADAWRWAIVEFLDGANAGLWRVVTSYAHDGETATLGWHVALPNPVLEGDTFRLDHAPLGGATVFLRQVIPASLQPSEMPAVFVASQRTRTLSDRAIGRSQGSVAATLHVRTDLLSPWNGEAADEAAAFRLFEQIDQMRLTRTGLAGKAQFATPDRSETIVGFGELDRGERVYWSTLWTPLHYPA